MNQVLHILKKDIRCFRMEIVLVSLSAILSVRNSISEGGISQPVAFTALFWIAGTLLISRVIHAEAIPGDRLYWLTRPYRWKSLVAEKMLFLFLFVGLPPAIVILVSLEGAGFPLGAFLPSLLFRELTIFLAWIIPVAALAAVTESLAAFLVGLLFVGALWTTLSGVLCCSPTQLLPSEIVWVPASFSALILVWGAVAILYIQYRLRRTMLGRVGAAVSVILCIVAAIFTPFALGIQVQSLFSQAGIDHSSMVVSLENDRFWRDYGSGFLLDLKGMPPGLDAHANALVAEVVSNDGKAVNVSMNGVPTHAAPAGTSRILAYISDGDIARLRGKTVTVRGSVYVTLYSAPRSWQQDAFERFETAVEGVRCGNTGNGSYFTCRAMLGSPHGRLSIQPLGKLPVLGIGSGSYWPLFPALWLSPYEVLSFPWQYQPRTVEFHYTEAVSHFWLNFDIPVEHFLE